MNDESLIDSYLKGDQESLGILYDRYFAKVCHTCFSYSRNRDDAFDLAQDVLLKAICSLGTFKGGSAFSTWLFSITRNHCINQVSRHKSFPMEAIDLAGQVHSEELDQEALLERMKREELESELDQTLELLTGIDRKMMELKYRHNYSVKELQDEFNLSASAVKMRLLRARQKVEQFILIGHAA